MRELLAVPSPGSPLKVPPPNPKVVKGPASVPPTVLQLNIVTTYKHLGSYLACTGQCGKNIGHRCASALAAYSPLAAKLFGSDRLADSYKLLFLSSLVFLAFFITFTFLF